MTSNPLAARRTEAQESYSQPINGVRTVFAKDKDGTVIKTINIRRSHQPYAQDLADAYNDQLSDRAKEMGLQWFVMPSGEVKLGERLGYSEAHTKDLERAAEQQRQRWLHRHRYTAEQLVWIHEGKPWDIIAVMRANQ